MNLKVLISAIFASLIAVAGCDSSSTSGTGGSGGTAGTGGSGGGEGGAGGAGGVTPPGEVNCDELPNLDAYVVDDHFDNVPPTIDTDCTPPMFMPGDDAGSRLNTRVDNADIDDVICMAAGTYEMDRTITISLVPGLTLKGIGDSPDDTVLNFAGPGSGKGIFVQTDNVIVENLWVKNTGDNGIEQDGTTGSVFKKVHVSWDNEDKGMNGAYAVYPTNCEETVVEFSQMTDARDAGIYIGKCGWGDDTDGGIVRYNIVGRNVLGLEAENCQDVRIHDNLVIGNTGGLFAAQQPMAATPSNSGILVEDNDIWCNNHPNFATTGVVEIIPVGSGYIGLAGDGVEVRNNDIQENDTIAVGMVSNILTCLAADRDCPPYGFAYNPYAVNQYIHDNHYFHNGTNADPDNDFYPIFLFLGIGTEDNPVEEVIWDGFIVLPDEPDPGICLGADNTASYRDLTQNQCQTPASPEEFILCVTTNSTTETTGRLCDPIEPAAN
jgi:parallel beta-helix repeat protein